MSLTLLAAFALSSAPPAAPTERVTLAPKSYRTWRIDLPRDPFRVVSGAIPIPHAHGAGFAAEVRGAALVVDTDGDGQVDRTIEGVVDPTTKVASARVTLAGKRADGTAFTYPVRLEGAAGAWKWAAGGALEGDLAGTPVRVVDLDGNGRFGDVGSDAIVVGEGDVAQLLGETVHVDGALRSVTVDASGAFLEAAPFAGPTGALDLRAALGAKGVLLSALVVSEDGRQAFDLAHVEGGAQVPVGRYRLARAALGLGEARVTVDASGVAPLEVAAGAEVALAWGAPVRATFVADRQGDQLVLDPSKVAYVGRAGERWLGWDPIGKSPTFRVKEKETGDVLVDVVFPGSC